MNRNLLLFLCLFISVASGAAPDLPSIEELRRKVAQLEAQLEALGKVPPPPPQAVAPAAPLKEIESALAEIRARLEQLEASAAEQRDTLASMSESEGGATHVGVYGTFSGSAYSGRNSIFDAESFELILSGQPHERLGFFAEVEFERPAAVGAERGGEIVVEQASATLSASRLFNVRAGILLIPFGNYNMDHYAPNRDVITRPLVSEVVAPGDWTDNGVELFGEALAGSMTLSYDVCVVAGLDANLTALGTRAARQAFGVDNNQNKSIVGRLAVDYLGKSHLGLSGYSGRYDGSGRDNLDGWALDGLATLGPLNLTGEVDRLVAHRRDGPDSDYRGYNLRGTLEFGSRFLRRGAHGAAFPDAEMAFVAQYGRVDVRGPLDGQTFESSESRLTLGLTYRPSHEWVLKLGRELNTGKGLVLVNGDSDAWLGSVGFVF